MGSVSPPDCGAGIEKPLKLSVSVRMETES